MTDDAFRRIDALIQVGLRLARSAPSGRIALARIAASIEPEWIPRPWGAEILAELEAAKKAAGEPVAFGTIERALRDAWGVRPAEELEDLEADPSAVTPSAQIHRGVLDGRTVAIKVLRPGLTASVRQDLAVLEGLLAPLGAAFPALDPVAVLREIRERILDELDLEHEAATQRRFHRALRRHPFLTVPAPITRLASENVLVSDWVDGVPLWQAVDPDQAGARLMVFALGSARTGLIHADFHPDDVLVLADGRVAILDFGAVREVDRARVALAAAALDALATDDPGAFAGALEQLGWLPARHAGTALALAREVLGPFVEPGPVRLDSNAVITVRDRMIERPRELAQVLLAGALPPEDLWPARGAAQLFGSIARVGASGDWIALARAGLREGWDVSV